MWNKDFNKYDSKSRVKLYKTHHGWFSCLNRLLTAIFSIGGG